MMTDDIRKHVRVYLTVFFSLMVLTFVTVGVSYMRFPIVLAIAVALAIASIKGGLVACYFMHLISEKKLICAVLTLTCIFLLALLFLPVFVDLERVVLWRRMG